MKGYTMKFNLRKYSETVKKTEEALEPQRENLEDVTGTYNALLESVRKNKEDAPICTTDYELRNVRLNEELSDTTEAQLDSHKPGKGMPKRTGDDQHDQLPINLLEEKAHQDKIKAFKNTARKDYNTEFWDNLLLPESDTPSQLHNHPDRFKNLTEDGVLKNEGVRKMVMASLQDADAMLYHIYREAAQDGRELNDQENAIIAGITADKIRIVGILVAK
jgi:hypothetical protein